MNEAKAIAGSAAFLILVPGTVAGLGPWSLTSWARQDAGLAAVPLAVAGGALVVAGIAALLGSFARFALEGRGTPAPAAPPDQLVVSGLYRYVRNPMYVAVAAIILGQALLLAQPVLLGYLALFVAVVAAFVRFHEEPALRRRFGAQYDAYRRAVRAWWPQRPPTRSP